MPSAEKAQVHGVLLRAAIYESHLLEGAGEHERAAQAARQGIASAREYGLARATGTLLAANVAEPLMSLGRWDEAADVIEHALELSPPPGTRAVLLQLAGQLALARGDLPGAADSAAASRGALAGFGYRDQIHLPLARLETELHLARDQAGDALTVAEHALDRFDLQRSPRYAWPLLAAGARACGAALTATRPPPVTTDLAERARRLLDRLRTLAEKMNATGPVQRGAPADLRRGSRAGGQRGGRAGRGCPGPVGRGSAGMGSPRSALPAGPRAAARRRGRHGPR